MKHETVETPLPTRDVSSGRDEIDLSELVRSLWRGKWIIMACAFVAASLGITYGVVLATPMYSAQSTIAFEVREGGQVVDLESVVGGFGGDQTAINTELEVLRSRGLMEKLALRLDLASDPEFNFWLRPPNRFSLGGLIGAIKDLVGDGDDTPVVLTEQETLDTVATSVARAITITNIRYSYVFKINVSTTDPVKSARIANALAEVYILDQLEVKFEATEQATEWLTERVSELKTALEGAVEKVKDFSASSELISPEALAAMSRQIKDLRDRARDAQTAVGVTATRVETLQRAQSTGDLVRMAEAADDQTLTRLLGLMQDGAVSDQTGFDTRFAQILARAELEAARATSQAQALKASIKELEAQTASQSADLGTLQQLEREAEASRLIYEYFLGRLKETSVQQGIQQADARVLSFADVPRGPSEPRSMRIKALSLFLGLLIGGAIVLIREVMQNTIRSAQELEALTGYTVMGQIPMIPAKRRDRVLQYLTEKPTSAAAEAIRNLRTSTLLSNVDQPPQVVMSTSSVPGEGKTTQSLALSHNLSGLGKKVLLIEGDIRRRVFSEYFDIKEKRGLLAVLSGEVKPEDVVIHHKDLGADILIGEKSNINAADIFSSAAFAKFLTDARKLYDYIIIDTPPVLVVPDARVIGQSVDAILYTVRWDHTTRRQVSEGIKSFESVNLRVSGLVLGQINSKGMKRYGYGDAYGAYGAYSAGYYDN